ncbi:MAG: hypothetical protein LBV07_01490, partial [Syntrophobacterales bacterium]|nr:hypothetical protein [Syntrophobacterales bacterium]
MIIDHSKMTAIHGYFEGSADAVDQASAQKAIQYKKEVCKNYINVSSDQIDSRLGGTEFYATRKYDGEMNVLFLDGDQAALINRSGRVRTGLPCAEDAKVALNAAGITQAVIPAELFAEETDGRTRVFHVLTALADPAKTSSLRLAVFDILELNNAPFRANSYSETHAKITDIFGQTKLCSPVEYRKCQNKAHLKETYSEWVEKGGAEGLVVRTELPLIYKVKPRYTIDTAIVGFSEGTGEAKGQVRSLLLAMMPRPDEYQIIGKTGNGFSVEARTELLTRLEPLIMDSQYIETDSNHVAFHMIKPEIVIELMINDVLFDTSTGFIDNAVLSIQNNAYIHKGQVHGISVVFPIFVRFRDDKKAVYEDIRLEQINDFSYIDPDAAAAGLPSRHVRGIHPILPDGDPLQDGHLGGPRSFRRERRNGRADVDACRRHDLQGSVRPANAIQSARRLQ